ncbi:hypothetical protein Dimus_002880 [Dionaea muscipula]
MTDVFQGHKVHAEKMQKLQQPSVPLLPDVGSTNPLLSKELAAKTRELRQIKGEELEGLSLEDLIRLERQVEKGQSLVKQMKAEKLLKLIAAFKGKEALLVEENKRLKEQVEAKAINLSGEQGSLQSPQSFNNNPCLAEAHDQDEDLARTSLRLGVGKQLSGVQI